MAGYHQHGSEDKHCSTLTLAVEEVAEERSHGSSSQREYEEYISSLFCCEVQVALQHVDGILLEWEDCTVVEYAKQGNNPEHAERENLANVGNLEWVVLLLLSTLSVEFLIHETVYYEADKADAHKKQRSCYRAAYAYRSDGCQSRRTNHDNGNTYTCDSHLDTHGKSHLMSGKPFHDTTAYGNTGHLCTATENHESDSGELGRSRHAVIPRCYVPPCLWQVQDAIHEGLE